ACNNDKKNILHYIASSPAQDRAEIAEEVIRAGADINGGDKYETTPLHLALMCGHLSLCRYLITETDADLTARNSRQVGML
ncbi:ankyrin repeat domain-containing protein, partial [Klebsiella pneumoniae]|nr:ankyrin repeat domain-containing protein [Klebsiella pneumoniae]